MAYLNSWSQGGNSASFGDVNSKFPVRWHNKASQPDISTGVPLENATPDANGNIPLTMEQMYAQYFGGQVRDQAGSNPYERWEHGTFPDAYGGAGSIFSAVFIRVLTASDRIYVTRLLPYKQSKPSDGLKVSWNEWHFLNTEMNRAPEEAPFTLTEQAKSSKEAGLIRYNKGFSWEITFLDTPDGQIEIKYKFKQVANAVDETCCKDVSNALLNCEEPNVGYQQSHGKRLNQAEYNRLLRDKLDQWCMCQKDEHGWETMLDLMKNKLKERGRPLDKTFTLLPSGLLKYIQSRPEYSKSYLAGGSGKAPPPPPPHDYAEGRLFVHGSDVPNYDPLFNDVSIGEYLTQNERHLLGVPWQFFRTSMLDTDGFNEDTDGWYTFTYKDSLKTCGLFFYDDEARQNYYYDVTRQEEENRRRQTAAPRVSSAAGKKHARTRGIQRSELEADEVVKNSHLSLPKIPLTPYLGERYFAPYQNYLHLFDLAGTTEMVINKIGSELNLFKALPEVLGIKGWTTSTPGQKGRRDASIDMDENRRKENALAALDDNAPATETFIDLLDDTKITQTQTSKGSSKSTSQGQGQDQGQGSSRQRQTDLSALYATDGNKFTENDWIVIANQLTATCSPWRAIFEKLKKNQRFATMSTEAKCVELSELAGINAQEMKAIVDSFSKTQSDASPEVTTVLTKKTENNGLCDFYIKQRPASDRNTQWGNVLEAYLEGGDPVMPEAAKASIAAAVLQKFALPWEVPIVVMITSLNIDGRLNQGNLKAYMKEDLPDFLDPFSRFMAPGSNQPSFGSKVTRSQTDTIFSRLQAYMTPAAESKRKESKTNDIPEEHDAIIVRILSEHLPARPSTLEAEQATAFIQACRLFYAPTWNIYFKNYLSLCVSSKESYLMPWNAIKKWADAQTPKPRLNTSVLIDAALGTVFANHEKFYQVCIALNEVPKEAIDAIQLKFKKLINPFKKKSTPPMHSRRPFTLSSYGMDVDDEVKQEAIKDADSDEEEEEEHKLTENQEATMILGKADNVFNDPKNTKDKMDVMEYLFGTLRIDRGDFFQWCADKDIWPSLGFILARPNMTYRMGTVIYMIPDGYAGQTWIKEVNVMKGANNVTKTGSVHLSMYAKAIVMDPASVVRMRNQYSSDYIGGGGIIPFAHDDNVMRHRLTDTAQDAYTRASLFVLAVPLEWKFESRWWLNLTGKCDKGIVANTDNEKLHYPSARIYKEHWGFRNPGEEAENLDKLDELMDMGVPYKNVLVFQGCQKRFRYIGNGQGDRTDVILNSGHWGERVYPKCGQVRRGAMKYLSSPDYVGVKVVSLQA